VSEFLSIPLFDFDFLFSLTTFLTASGSLTNVSFVDSSTISKALARLLDYLSPI
jgi:hypothetical protein